METRRNLVHVFIKAESEDKLQARLLEIELETQKTPDVTCIYPRGSFVYAWIRIESKHIEYKTVPKETVKKKTKKKVIKK